MKSIAVCVVGVIVLLVVGTALFPWMTSWMDQGRKGIDDRFRGGVGDDYIVESAEKELAEATNFVRRQYIKAAQGKQKLAAMKASRDAQKAKLARNEEILQKAAEWLQSHSSGDTSDINGQEYSFAVIAADARTRTEICETSRETITALDESCQIMANAVAQSEAQVRDALNEIEKIRGGIEAKKVQLAALRAIAQAEQFARGMEFGGVDTADIANRFNRELDDRIAKLQAERDFSQLNSSVSGGVVPWETSHDVDQDDLATVLEYQKRHLSSSAPETPASGASLDEQDPVDVVDALSGS